MATTNGFISGAMIAVIVTVVILSSLIGSGIFVKVVVRMNKK